MDSDAAPIAIIALLVLMAIASTFDDKAETPCPDGYCPEIVGSLADVPPMLRQENWDPLGYGSCVHASTITILRSQGQTQLADWWRATYYSGEYGWRLIERLNNAGIRYAYTDKGDVEFLEWACRNRMGLGIFYFPRHAVNLVELNEREAVLIDNNRPNSYIRIPREQFIRNWKAYGGFAWTVVYQPPPPTPTWN